MLLLDYKDKLYSMELFTLLTVLHNFVILRGTISYYYYYYYYHYHYHHHRRRRHQHHHYY
jgi:hypothetical protein